MTEHDISELVKHFSSAINVDSVETIISSDALLTELTPLLFDANHHQAAYDLLLLILQSKPKKSETVASSILSYIQSLQLSDDFLLSDALLKLLASQLHSPVVSLATQSSHALQRLCHIRPPTIDRLVKQDGILLPIPDAKDSTVMIRYYTLIANMLSSQKDLTSYINGNGADNVKGSLFHNLLKGLENDSDPLLQLSLLEVLEQADPLFLQNEAWDGTSLDFVLNSMTGNGKSKELHPFGAGAALRLLALRKGTSSTEQFYALLENFAKNMSGEIEKIGFIDGLATFCTNDESLNLILTKYNEGSGLLLDEWLNLRGGQSKLKAVVLNSVAQVLKRQTLSHDLRLGLFKTIGAVNDVGSGADSIEVVMTYVKSKVVELRFGAYELLTAVAGVKLGSHTLMRYGGFYEFCCNRNSEVVKEGKELKFGLVKALVRSDVKGLLSDEVVSRLEQVVKDGPYYVEGNKRDVALE